jgi:hypothetical protein
LPPVLLSSCEYSRESDRRTGGKTAGVTEGALG